MSVSLHNIRGNIREWCTARREEIFLISRALCGGALVFAMIALVFEMLRPGIVVSYVSPAAVIVVAIASGATMLWSSDGKNDERIAPWLSRGARVIFAAFFFWILSHAVGGWQGVLLGALCAVVIVCAGMIE